MDVRRDGYKIFMIKKTSSTTSLAFGFLVGANILWSSGGVLIKWVSWNPLAIAGVRSAISAVILLIFIGRPNFTWSFAQVGGALSFAATVILFVTATKLTTAANAILLQYTAPIYTALFSSWFLGERTVWYDWTTIFIVIGGIVLFFMDNLTIEGYWGNIIAVVCGITTAWMVLFLRKQKSGSPFESIVLGNIITAIIGSPFMWDSAPSIYGWVGLIFLGVFQLGFSFILYVIAIKQVTALDAVLVSTIEPILNPVWVFLFLNEAPGRMAILGGSVVFISVTVRCICAYLFRNYISD